MIADDAIAEAGGDLPHRVTHGNPSDFRRHASTWTPTGWTPPPGGVHARSGWRVLWGGRSAEDR